MLDYKDFKDRVTRLEDGTWCWRCPVDDSIAESSYRLTFPYFQKTGGLGRILLDERRIHKDRDRQKHKSHGVR